jgi:GNAT superfamily N-acetyltransferase
MCDEWMPTIRLVMTIDDFHRLPRNAAYKYEYFDGAALFSPRPKTMHAVLDISGWAPLDTDLAPAGEYAVVPLEGADRDDLARLFSGAFAQTQPFASITDAERLHAASECLRRAFDGGEGPLVEEASFAARSRRDNSLVGAIVITLLPEVDANVADDYRWPQPPPADLWQRGGGRPHVTWIFTHAWHKGEGIGTRLLAAAIAPLRQRGDKHLYTTFIAGNDSSMLWHWRNGFQLLPYDASKRGIRRKLRGEAAPAATQDRR